jgi:ankyrin repeat protein
MGSQVIEAVLYSSRDALLDALHKGGNPNDEEDGTSALTMACVQDRADLAGDLVQHGARVNAADQDGSTPLFVAAGLGSESLTRVLLDAGADVRVTNDIGQTPLMVAAKSGSSEVVEMLLKAHADVRAHDKRGLSALHWAITGGDFAQVVQLLLSSGTNPGDRTLDGQSALDYAVSLNRRGIIGVLTA